MLGLLLQRFLEKIRHWQRHDFNPFIPQRHCFAGTRLAANIAVLLLAVVHATCLLGKFFAYIFCVLHQGAKDFEHCTLLCLTHAASIRERRGRCWNERAALPNIPSTVNNRINRMSLCGIANSQ